MKSNFLGPIFGLALLFALIAGGYFLFKYVVGVFATLDPQIETLAVIASVVALLCAVILAEGLKARAQQEQYSIGTVEKAKVYERLLSLCCEQLTTQGNENDRPADAELVQVERFLALHGGAKVISAYVEFQRSAKQDGKPAGEVATPLNKLVLEMRADLGRSEVIRNAGDLIEILSGRRHKA